jgi:hypothetical protein
MLDLVVSQFIQTPDNCRIIERENRALVVVLPVCRHARRQEVQEERRPPAALPNNFILPKNPSGCPKSPLAGHRLILCFGNYIDDSLA